LNTGVVGTVVIGIGNEYRRDDGVGPAVAAAIDERALPGVRVVTAIQDPISLLDVWSGVALAVVIDAAVASPSAPGRIHRITVSDVTSADGVSTHGLDVTQVLALGQALGRAPDQLVVFTVEAADIGHGVGLTPQVSAAVPEVVASAVAEIVGRSAEQLDDN
jgi:hydrogenase maturation protease